MEFPMARLARVVIPGIPHHVTQRGNGRANCENRPRAAFLHGSDRAGWTAWFDLAKFCWFPQEHPVSGEKF